MSSAADFFVNHASVEAVAAQLRRYGRRCQAKLGRDLPDAQARAAQIGYADPLVFRLMNRS